MMWDVHMHTSFSGDSDTAVQDMIEMAISRNLDGICITDHLDFDYPQEPDLFLLDLPRYDKEIRRYQALYADRIPVCFGIELGLQPHLADRHRRILCDYAFDFVIGSSHVVHGTDPYYPEYYHGRTEAEAYREYFESILENIAAFDDFDVYGHIDYVVRYGPNKNNEYSYEKYKDVLDEILRVLIEKGKGIEVNTAGFKYGLGQPNPAQDVLFRYRELGGEIITLGADAHVPEHVAYDFHKLPDLLKACGFSRYTVFHNRKPEFLSL